MRYEQDFIEKVRDANNLVDIISQYTELKGRGSNHLGLCPFPDHREKSPSFSVSEDKQVYYCFGCKKSGNIFTFLEVYNGLSFVEAIEFLAQRAHIALPAPVEGDKVNRQRNQNSKTQLARINRMSAVFYHQKLMGLPSTHKLRAYLEKRGLTNEIIEEFRLGYAPEGWSELSETLVGKGAPTQLCEKLGLIRPNKKGGYYDLFRDRLMFPIFSIDGKVIGFGGRVIDQGQPKYINSVESDLFKKGQSLYGLDKSAKHIRSEDRVFVVEGYMDLLSLYSQGIVNVVATLGTALTEHHVKLLKRWTKNVVLLFDGDQAGQEAGLRSLSHFLKQDVLPQVFVLPEGQDPDDYIRRVGRDEFLKRSEQTQDLFLYQLALWMREYRGQPKDKIELIDKVAPLLRDLGDQRLYQLYLQEVAERIGESLQKVFAWVKVEKPKADAPTPGPRGPMTSQNFTTSEAPAGASVAQAPEIKKFALKGVHQDELVLLGLSLKSPKLLDFLISQGGPECMGHPELRDIFAQVTGKYGQDPQEFAKLASLVVSQLQEPEKIVRLINFSSLEEATGQDDEVFVECLIRVKDRFYQRLAADLVAQMKIEPSDTKLERFVNIQNERKALKELKNTPLGE